MTHEPKNVCSFSVGNSPGKKLSSGHDFKKAFEDVGTEMFIAVLFTIVNSGRKRNP